jgi:ABC-type multidrug transport system fused ATPase/permease subunit
MFVSLLGIFLRGSVDSGLISLSLSYIMVLTGLVQFTVRTTIDVENNMTSVERLAHYSLIESEAPHVMESNKLPKNWPENGEISFKELKLKYRKELDYALRGISLSIKRGEKIGICGRTGSGKSTLILALFRIVEFEGLIEIDEVDISKIGLHDLRSRISIIPQDPILLSGSVRFNLDV